MAAVQNGSLNGTLAGPRPSLRFSDIPSAIDIPVEEGEVEVDLTELLEDPTELCQLLENEKAARHLWVQVALAYAKQAQPDHSIDILNRGLASLARSQPKDRLSLLSGIAWLCLLKSRTAPRVFPEDNKDPNIKLKDHYLKDATATINEALRLNPSFVPLHLIRGVLYLLRASLTVSLRTSAVAEAERADSLKQALKFFEDALKASDGRNVMAIMGRARAMFMQGRFALALQEYQVVLTRMPGFRDPDPRIGIGCCLWQLGYPHKACAAWERALELTPTSKVAHALLGIYYLRESAKVPAHDPQFQVLYRKGMSEHIAKAHKIDKEFPISAALLAGYTLLTGRYESTVPLARTAVEKTDVNSVASDGWYVRARKEHNQGDLERASEYYTRADIARGGQERGYLPAKFGLAQIRLQSGQNLEEVKHSLESFASTKNIEAMTVCGCIYAEEYFAAQKSGGKEDKSLIAAKAIKYLENIRKTWTDEATKSRPDETILLYLARLYETEQPSKSMKCLGEVEKMQMDKITDEELPPSDDPQYTAHVREQLSPQLLNNIACYHYSTEQYDLAVDTFEIALNACLKLSEKQKREKEETEVGALSAEDVDTSDADALVTTISYNLGRSHEAFGQIEDAKKIYSTTLDRHPDYTDASTRLAYITLAERPKDEGPKQLQTVYSNDYGDLDVRALMGWYYHASKKRVTNLAEDQENRHYKHTLTGYDKHDLYSLTGMGNVHLAIARDMPRNNEQEREKRSKMYGKAYEFFEKAVQLDPKNAYAAQGIGIILCDDRKMYPEALQIFTKVKDTLRDGSIYTNLGHAMTEVRQYQRGIDNYNMALHKLGGKDDPQIQACLSRTWLLKGKQDRSISALNQSLEHMHKALSHQAENPHLRFNVAFIHFQIAQLVNSAKETERTLEDVDAAIAGLDSAIATFEEVAQLKQPPYPKQALEQRAAMGRNTMRGQLNRARMAQDRYENENKEKLVAAKQRREAEIRRREEERLRKQHEEEERGKEVTEGRRKIVNETEMKSEQLRAEQLAKEAAEWTSDSETGERVKRKEKNKGKGRGGGGGRKRKKIEGDFIDDDDAEASGVSGRSVSRTPMSGGDSDGDGMPTAAAAAADGEGRKGKKEKQPRKKRKLERKAKPKVSSKKFKSKETVDDSDEEGDVGGGMARDESEEPAVETPKSGVDEDLLEEDAVVPNTGRKRKQLRTIADEDDEEMDGEGAAGAEDAEHNNADLASAALAAVEGVDDDE